MYFFFSSLFSEHFSVVLECQRTTKGMTIVEPLMPSSEPTFEISTNFPVQHTSDNVFSQNQKFGCGEILPAEQLQQYLLCANLTVGHIHCKFTFFKQKNPNNRSLPLGMSIQVAVELKVAILRSQFVIVTCHKCCLFSVSSFSSRNWFIWARLSKNVISCQEKL